MDLLEYIRSLGNIRAVKSQLLSSLPPWGRMLDRIPAFILESADELSECKPFQIRGACRQSQTVLLQERALNGKSG